MNEINIKFIFYLKYKFDINLQLDFVIFTLLFNLINFVQMKKITFCLALFCAMFLSLNSLKAQDYKSAIGAKLGYGLMGSYKTFLNEKAALDIFAGIQWSSGLGGGVMYQHHMPINSVERLKWFVGGGATFFTYGGTNTYFELTINPNLGLDYSFTDFPLNISLDYAPGIVVYNNYNTIWGTYSRFRSGYYGLTARYILK